jgi:3alpha(or 20beta)-hydroxysteroid dehydrogenase
MGRLAGKTAIVTGGARSMGEATARLFVAEGARVIIADVLAAEGQKLAGELGAAAMFQKPPGPKPPKPPPAISAASIFS